MMSVHCSRHLRIILCLNILWNVLTNAARPNVILIVADDLGWNDVSFHGSQQIPTPNLDRLAHAGIILNNYYVQPICTPTRSALMTGKYPIHTGLQHGVIIGSAPYGLGLNETIMPQFLKRLGYDTHIVGKWHLGFYAKEYTPNYRGFDSYYGYYLGKEDYWDHTSDVRKISEIWGLDFRRNMDIVRNDFGRYSTELFTEETIRIIKDHNQSKPLFLYLPHQAVHSANEDQPLQAPYKYYERFSHIKHEGRRKYAAMVAALDDSVGNITRALNDSKMLQNSIVIFTTDNGGPAAGFDLNYASNYPLRGMKNTLWEGGCRGAGFVYSPLLEQTGYVSKQLMHVTDWLPTILSAVGESTSILNDVDGHDMWKTLSDKSQSPRKEVLYNIDPTNKNAAVRIGDYKLIMGKAMGNSGWYPPEGFAENSSWADSQLYFKPMDKGVIECGEKPPHPEKNCNTVKSPCLFNLALDPCEYTNIAKSEPKVVEYLLQRLSQYNSTAVPAKNLPMDPKGFPVYHNKTWGPWVVLKP